MRDAQRYEVKDLIARGGMAEVYRGESAGIEGFRKKVAIKRVLPKLSANQDFINMFLDEARLCAYLNHSRCVQVFDIGQGAGSHFIVMEYVDGSDLKGVMEHLSVRQQAMHPAMACLIGMQICEGLAYAHQAADHHGNPLQIVHRDISPHNVLMTRYGEVKLVDFGLAKASSHLTDEDEDVVKGKFGYLAPEVTLRLGVDHRVDIFAAGILLWEMLAGRRLFLGETDLETFKQVQAARIPDLRKLRSDVSDELMMVIAKALARERDQRYQSADALARDLAVVLTRLGQPVTYQDVGVTVKEAAEAAAKNKKPKTQDAEGVIGELILDTLHEFSALDDDDAPQAAPAAARPAATPASYEDPTAWGLGDEFGELFDAPAKSPAPTEELLELEDAEPAPRPPPPPRARPKPPPSSDQKEAGPWWKRWFD